VFADAGPSREALERAEALYALLARDAAFARVRRLWEIDWSEADATVEDVGLLRLMRHEAQKLLSVLDGAAPAGWADVADAIRWTERHDGLAQTALWWLGQLAADPALAG
jgi:hypothetical protein